MTRSQYPQPKMTATQKNDILAKGKRSQYIYKMASFCRYIDYEPGGIEENEMPMSISNVAIYNPTTKKADRIGVRVNDEGVKERFFKSNGEAVI